MPSVFANAEKYEFIEEMTYVTWQYPRWWTEDEIRGDLNEAGFQVFESYGGPGRKFVGPLEFAYDTDCLGVEFVEVTQVRGLDV